MTFAEKLARLRREQNYTQEQFADLLGVSRQSVSKWESGLAYPETEKLIKIGEMFDCSIDYLLRDSIEDMSPTAQTVAKPKKKKMRIASVTVVSVLAVMLLAIAFIPRDATLTISSHYAGNEDGDYQLTYKEIAQTVNFPLPGEEYLYTHGTWDLDQRGYGDSAFGVVDAKNVNKGTVGSRVLVDYDFSKLYIYDNGSGMWRIFKLDSYTDNTPLHIKVNVDKGNGEYYQYYVS